MTAQSGHKPLKRQIVGRLSNFRALCVCGHDEARGTVQSFQHQPAAEQFVPLAVRYALIFFCAFADILRFSAKHRVDGKVRLLVRNRCLHIAAIFEQKQITEKRGRGLSKTTLTVSNPDVFSASYRLFGSIVHIIADGLARLGFKLHCQQQLASRYDNQVPFLRGPRSTPAARVLYGRAVHIAVNVSVPLVASQHLTAGCEGPPFGNSNIWVSMDAPPVE